MWLSCKAALVSWNEIHHQLRNTEKRKHIQINLGTKLLEPFN